ncbi:low molecular weight protein arginine phosphatase [Ferdinandcohnia sp. Marseille-Q9671]
MNRVLFVCTGNTCRSPMAEAILRSKAPEGIEVKSAGIFASSGSPASSNTSQVLTENGIQCQHSSSFLTKELIEWATCILTMTHHHKQEIMYRFPEVDGKIYTLKEFTNGSGDVSDPFGGPVEIYRETYAELEPLIDQVLSKLKR